MEKEIKEKVVKRITFYLECPICKRDISGVDKPTALRNFKRHTIKCNKEDKK